MTDDLLTRRLPAARPLRARIAALFATYLVVLVWLVVWKLEVPFADDAVLRRLKLVPFVAGGGYAASEPSEVLLNVLVFVPFGIYLGLLAPGRPWARHLAAIAGASLAMEAAQYVLAVGSADVTDVITNTAGGVVGLVLLSALRRGLGRRTDAAMARVCLAATVVVVAACAVFVASPVHYLHRIGV
ncbi:VanZ family protein [Microbacterium sp. No. 7]|uniref:VanZ family protein n=1 Tax=Microbacterium sp. No. 7 TaxID=1714373 RepID=UPI0006D036B9|nr:VanZ family protein [Microbacterium sp. No. 7]ALJ19106.1 hypothetical protein AOA12_03980 [Microbacterium sp. No. 7]